MTGFSRVQVATDRGVITVEIKSVNHRYLDVQFRLPRGLLVIEESLKSCLTKWISRGRVEVYVTISPATAERRNKINQEYLGELIQELRELEHRYQIDGSINWQALLLQPGVWDISSNEVVYEQIGESVFLTVEKAVEDLAASRQMEGNQLVLDLKRKMDVIEELLIQLQALAQSQLVIVADKLQTRVQTLLEGAALDPLRIAQEVAFLADKSSIEEELVRLHIHVKHFMELILTEGPVGRKLDFYIQELNREMNTTSAKSTDTEIAKLVVEVKSILEQCREQVQNLE